MSKNLKGRRRSGGTPLEKYDTRLLKLTEENANFRSSIQIDFTGKSMLGCTYSSGVGQVSYLVNTAKGLPKLMKDRN